MVLKSKGISPPSKISPSTDTKLLIPSSIDFYNTIVINDFMTNRIVDLEDGDVVSEG